MSDAGGTMPKIRSRTFLFNIWVYIRKLQKQHKTSVNFVNEDYDEKCSMTSFFPIIKMRR